VQIGPTAAGSSSSQQQQPALSGDNFALTLHVPHVVSVLLSALKSAVALRNAAPRLALSVASCIAQCRVETAAADWLHAPRGVPKLDLKEICSMSVEDFRSRLKQLQHQPNSPQVAAGLSKHDMDKLPDSDLRIMLTILPDEHLQLLLAPPAPPRVGASTRGIGHCSVAEQIVSQGFFTFQPGGISSSSSVVGSNASGNVLWYNEQVANMTVPWVTVAARSMWLMGQSLGELLPGSSNSSSSSSSSSDGDSSGSSHPRELTEVDAEFFKQLLESAFSCCEWIG
jgi:hypothetical protein